MSEGDVALLEAHELTLRAGPRTLVEGLTLRVDAGQLWCILGANGSGKTTLLHTLSGLREPEAGRVRLAGRPLADWPLAEAARLRGLLPQVLRDAFSATALEVVLLGRHPHLARWGWEDDADRELALRALRTVDLHGVEERDVTTLSGGERQRVGIAALLAQDPALLLLDEPVAHLDLRHQIVVLECLRELARSGARALMLSVHDLNLARRFATHALVLGDAHGSVALPRQGRVEEVMDSATLSAAFAHPVLRESAGGRTVFIAQ